MRRVLNALLAVVLLFSQIDHLQAQTKARSIISKAIQAHGGKARVAKLRVMRVKISGKGSFLSGSVDLPFTLEDTWQMPDQYKTVMLFNLNGTAFSQTQILNNDQGWININGRTQPLPAAALTEMKEQKYTEDLDRLLGLNNNHKLSILEDIKVDGRPGTGIKITSKGHRDVILYFDKTSGLLLKREQQIPDETGKLILQEVYFRDYREKEGVQHWMAIEARRNGKKFLEAEVVKLEFFRKLPDSEFAKP